jgi:hypothetical protein
VVELVMLVIKPEMPFFRRKTVTADVQQNNIAAFNHSNPLQITEI